MRHAAKHGLLTTKAVKRWFDYRDNHNDTAHDYGIAFVEETLKLIPHFLEDAYARLSEECRKSDLPISVDVLDWALIPGSFRQAIKILYGINSIRQKTAKHDDK